MLSEFIQTATHNPQPMLSNRKNGSAKILKEGKCQTKTIIIKIMISETSVSTPATRTFGNGKIIFGIMWWVEDAAAHHVVSTGFKHEPFADPVIFPQEMLSFLTHVFPFQ